MTPERADALNSPITRGASGVDRITAPNDSRAATPVVLAFRHRRELVGRED